MTDSTPPSIPPRKRPTTPTTAGRQTTSAPRTGSGPTWSASDDAATHVPNLNGANGSTAFTVPASVMPPTTGTPDADVDDGGPDGGAHSTGTPGIRPGHRDISTGS